MPDLFVLLAKKMLIYSSKLHFFMIEEAPDPQIPFQIRHVKNRIIVYHSILTGAKFLATALESYFVHRFHPLFPSAG
jgi:hypothetical protein